MIHRLLTEERIKTPLDNGIVKGNASPPEPKIILKAYTKKELAKKLSIAPEELEKLEFPDFYEEIGSKVSLSLIRLYCTTKFVGSEYQDKLQPKPDNST